MTRARWREISFAGALLGVAAVLAGCTAPGAEKSEASPTADIDYQQEANDSWWDLWMVEYPDAVKPDVEVVREISLNERGTVMADCLTAAGYPGTAAETDGSIGFELAPEGQKEAQAVAIYVCHAQYPLAEKYLRPLTPKQLGAKYDYWIGDLADCLEDHGFVSAEETPSRERYIQEEGTSSWNPFNGMHEAVGDEEYDRIAAACPRDIDAIY